MHDPTSVIPVRDFTSEHRRANTRRVVHEFAVYAIWHLSLTKPDSLAIRTLVNDMLQEWLDGFDCGNANCPYCRKDTNIANRTGFRSMYRNLLGRSERVNTQ
jgi:hypothetical protein